MVDMDDIISEENVKEYRYYLGSVSQAIRVEHWHNPAKESTKCVNMECNRETSNHTNQTNLRSVFGLTSQTSWEACVFMIL